MKLFTEISTDTNPKSLVRAGLLATATLAFALGASGQAVAESGSAKSGGLATGSAMKQSLSEPGAEIVHLVAEYQSYRKDLVTIATGDITSQSVRNAHTRIASRDHKTLSQAWVAYNSAVAARTPAYNKEIQKAAKRNKSKFLAGLDAQPGNALRLKSSQQASRAIVRNVSAESAQLAEMGSSFRTAAMDLQQSKKPKMVINQTTMDRFVDPTREDTLFLAGAGGSSKADPRSNNDARPMLGQMLTLAAHMSVTEKEGGAYSPTAVSLVENKKGERCLKWAKLNLAQCLAAARNTSEEAFCTGRHGLSEVSDCWSYMSGPSGTAS